MELKVEKKYYEIISKDFETIKIGDKVKLMGIFKEANIIGEVVSVQKVLNELVIRLEDYNTVVLNKKDVELFKKHKEPIIKKSFEGTIKLKEVEDIATKIKITGRRTTVTIVKSGIKASVYADRIDDYSEVEGIIRASKKAFAYQLLEEIKK